MEADLVNKVLKKVVGLVRESTSEYRETLDSNTHILDFSYSALRNSSPDLTQEEYTTLKDAVRKEYRPAKNLKEALWKVKDPSIVRGYAAFVEDPEFGTYIVSANYKVLQTKLAGVLKQLPGHAADFTGTDVTGKTVTNIGHISAQELNNTRSPLEIKLLKVLKAVPIGAAQRVLDNISKLHDTHTFTTSYNFQREDFNLKKFKSVLGTATVLVTLQTASYNNQLAQMEARIEADVRQYVQSSEFVEILLNTPGSNTIKEDIEKGIAAVFNGEKTVPGAKHGKKQPVSAKTKVQGKMTARKMAPIRDIKTGRFTSLANLQAILNFHLHDVVSANMGDGDRRDILNFRTGRFATSTKVERLTQSKEGMITAFYSYMKYPYATFSAGGRQSRPASRDPKLLISKSIREIAATIVANKLRAVNV